MGVERASEWKMKMTGDKGGDNDHGGGGDLVVCLEILLLQLPAIRLRTTAVDHIVSQRNDNCHSNKTQ